MADKSILIVEPDNMLAVSYEKILSKYNFRVFWADTAAEALVKLESKRPNAIIVELQLRGNNGIEFLYELRSYQDWQKIPVAIHTVVPQRDSLLSDATLRQLNIFEYCYKPRTSMQDLTRIAVGMIGKA